jgi:glyoxylase-like metal-dependent hydrolase (beta-lactamase superfamily II)
MLSRRKFLRRAGAAAALSPLLPSLAAGATDTAAAGTFTALRRGVGTYTQRGGTIGWLARGGRLVVVDTQYPKSARACWSGLRDRAGSDDLALLINTHHHGDHTGGNGVFKPKAEASVAHANAPKLQKASARESDSLDEQAYAETTFEEMWSESVGDETVTLRHFGPAHTGGDAVVFFEEANVVHMGDLVFNRAYPFIDVGGGADSRNWIAALETVHASLDDDTICIHGHGNPEYGVTGSREDLLVMRDFLSALNEYVAQQRQQGASLEEMKDVDGLDGFESFQFDWALSLTDCIEAVHREQTS